MNVRLCFMGLESMCDQCHLMGVPHKVDVVGGHTHDGSLGLAHNVQEALVPIQRCFQERFFPHVSLGHLGAHLFSCSISISLKA